MTSSELRLLLMSQYRVVWAKPTWWEEYRWCVQRLTRRRFLWWQWMAWNTEFSSRYQEFALSHIDDLQECELRNMGADKLGQ